MQEGFNGDENHKPRLVELEALDAGKLQAQQKLECYHTHSAQVFHKKVQPHSL